MPTAWCRGTSSGPDHSESQQRIATWMLALPPWLPGSIIAGEKGTPRGGCWYCADDAADEERGVAAAVASRWRTAGLTKGWSAAATCVYGWNGN